MGALDPNLGTLGAMTVYLVVMALVFVESGILLGFLLPGDTVLFAAGLLSAAPSSHVHLHWLLPGVVVAAVAGDALGYATGRRLGRPWLERRAQRGGHAAAHLRRTEELTQRWGSAALIVARFVPWVRTFAPVVAGVSRMDYLRFTSANVAGALVWGAGLLTLGRASAHLPWLRHASVGVAATVVVGSVVAGAVVAARARRARRP